jgi:hypothetical protein
MREQINLIFAFARLHGEKVDNPAKEVSPSLDRDASSRASAR